MRTYLNKDAAVGDSQHVELLTRVSWLSLRQIVASMGPGTYGTKLILSQPLKTKVTNRVLQQTKTRINVRRYCDLEMNTQALLPGNLIGHTTVMMRSVIKP